MNRPPGTILVERAETWRFPLTTPVNHYLIKVNNKIILVDAGAEPLTNVNPDIILLTHWHWDHTRGLTGLTDKTICAGEETLEILSSIDNIMNRVLLPLKAMGIDLDSENPNMIKEFFNKIRELYKEIVEALQRNKTLVVPECKDVVNLNIEAFHCPGHTEDHYCYKISNYVFVGDNATIGESPTTIDHNDYLNTILNILGRNWSYLAPGHGLMLERLEALKYFSSIINRKNKRLLLTLSIVASMGETTLNQLLEKVYRVKPEPQSYVPARTLIGYLSTLERFGLVKIVKSTSPWIVRSRVP